MLISLFNGASIDISTEWSTFMDSSWTFLENISSIFTTFHSSYTTYNTAYIQQVIM